jgi:acetylornithine aminotransferase
LTNVFFCSTGLEANEAALKLARKFGHSKGIEKPEIVVYEKSFHGRSLATLAATGNDKIKEGFGPMMEGFVRVPVNDIEALKKATVGNPNVVAVFMETIQGEGGVQPMRIEYMQAVRQLCDEQDWLMMVDEVQCGMGRTGKWFAHQWAGILPDVMPLAKGLGSGVPVGAVVAGPKAASIFQPGNHGTTFGGNPLAMAAGLATLRAIEAENLLHNAQRQGDAIRAGLAAVLQPFMADGRVREIRGRGLMIGVELDRNCTELVTLALDAGLLINVTHETVVRLLPPLIISDAESAELVERLGGLIQKFLQAR